VPHRTAPRGPAALLLACLSAGLLLTGCSPVGTAAAAGLGSLSTGSVPDDADVRAGAAAAGARAEVRAQQVAAAAVGAQREADERAARQRAVTGAVADAVAAGRAAGGTVRVAVSGDSATGAGAATPVHTASLVKLYVVGELLARSSAGTVTLTTVDTERMRRAVSRSDDTAMNALWVAHDGPALVRAAATRWGLTTTTGTPVAGQWGQVSTSADDLATFLTGLDSELGAAGAGTLRSWMRAAPATAADGFDQGFGLRSTTVDGAGDVAVKQGWMCCVAGEREVHSLGVLPDGTVVVLLGTFPSSVSWDTARAALTRAASGLVAVLR
jgi:hypothetical protein